MLIYRPYRWRLEINIYFFPNRLSMTIEQLWLNVSGVLKYVSILLSVKMQKKFTLKQVTLAHQQFMLSIYGVVGQRFALENMYEGNRKEYSVLLNIVNVLAGPSTETLFSTFIIKNIGVYWQTGFLTYFDKYKIFLKQILWVLKKIPTYAQSVFFCVNHFSIEIIESCETYQIISRCSDKDSLL